MTNCRFGARLHDVNGANLVVEQASYSDASGVTWAAGYAMGATKW